MDEPYQQLAEFRYQIRRFLHFSEEAAREHGLEPQQHQLLLLIKGLPVGMKPNVRTLSSRLYLRHNTTVELINRLVQRGLLVRNTSQEDRREVLVELTPSASELLQQLAAVHWQELQTAGAALAEALDSILAHSHVNQ
jgi:DNA-binding MarR family transcriptional regulator